jgi:hypothetical protein
MSDEIVPLFFKKNSEENHTAHLPRMLVMVEDDTLSVLLDTGAQAFLSKEAQSHLKCSEKAAISFINASIFNTWALQHPNWRIIEGGDCSFKEESDIIIVPMVQIGNRWIRNVAFAKRENYNFENMSTFFMDAPIHGAIGGNALNQLSQFTIDYQAERLLIKRE